MTALGLPDFDSAGLGSAVWVLPGMIGGCSKRLEFSGNFPVATLIKSNCLVSCSKID